MIQYAKLHQKDVISVIIPNFFSSPTVYSYLRLSVVRFQFMSGLVLFATHFGLTTDGRFVLAFRKARHLCGRGAGAGAGAPSIG